MHVINIAGWSGSGKTTLICKLLRRFSDDGLRAATIKHTHHRFDPLRGRPSVAAWRDAGAHEILLASNKRSALMHETGNEPEPRPEALTPTLGEVDIVLIEGFKSHAYDKIEVYRGANGTPLIANSDDRVVAVASDLDADGIARFALPGVSFFGLDDVAGIAAFIIAHGDGNAQGAA